MVCKDGRWPDHAAYFYKQLGEFFDYRVSKPVTRLKAPYFSVVTARLKKSVGAPPAPVRLTAVKKSSVPIQDENYEPDPDHVEETTAGIVIEH